MKAIIRNRQMNPNSVSFWHLICYIYTKIRFYGKEIEREWETEWERRRERLIHTAELFPWGALASFHWMIKCKDKATRNPLCQRFNWNSKAWPREKWQLKPQGTVPTHCPQLVIAGFQKPPWRPNFWCHAWCSTETTPLNFLCSV